MIFTGELCEENFGTANKKSAIVFKFWHEIFKKSFILNTGD